MVWFYTVKILQNDDRTGTRGSDSGVVVPSPEMASGAFKSSLIVQLAFPEKATRMHVENGHRVSCQVLMCRMDVVVQPPWQKYSKVRE